MIRSPYQCICPLPCSTSSCLFLWPRTTFISKLFLIIVASINVPYCSRCIAFYSTLIQFIRFIVFCSFFNVFMKKTFPFIVLISLQFWSWQGKINACNETWCITESSGCYQKWFDIYLISNAKASSVEKVGSSWNRFDRECCSARNHSHTHIVSYSF